MVRAATGTSNKQGIKVVRNPSKETLQVTCVVQQEL